MSAQAGKVDVFTAMPDGLRNMLSVTEESFAATAYQLNVHPCIVSAHDRVLGYRCDWKLQAGAGQTIATTIGGTHLSSEAFLVTPEFYTANRSSLVCTERQP